MTPLVSVVVPTHNRPHTLRTALASLAAQTLESFEVVVVNDGGADVSDVLAEFPALDIVYVVHETSRERSAARNGGIAAASGRYVAYLDDDDVFLPDHLESLVDAVRRSGLRAAYSDARRELRRVVDGEEVVLTTDVPYSVDFDHDRLRYENYIPVICLLHERSCVEEVGDFDTSFAALEDWEFFLRLASVTRFVHVPRVTACFGERVDGTRGDFLGAAERLFAKHPLPAGREDLTRLRAGYVAGLRGLAARPPASARPLTTIVIPTYNNLALTRQCLDAIERTTEPGTYELVVVDNASTDTTPAFLREAEEAGRLRAVLNGENRGFAAACNQGAAAARGDLVLFLNNDTVPHPGWLDALVREAADPAVGVVGSKLLYADGTVQHAGVVVGERDGDPHPYHVYLCQPADAPHVNARRELQMVTGACLLIRRALFEDVRGFDEAYWNGHEDLDLCLKARKAGAKVVYCPESVVTHLESQTKRLIGLEQFHYEKGADTPETRGRRLFLERWRDTLELDAPRILAEDGFGDGLHVLFTMVGWADEGGGTILPRQIAKALVRRGHRVTVLYAPVETRPDCPPYHLEQSIEDGVRLLALYNRPSRFNDPQRPERELDDPNVRALVRRIVAELKPDVVHLHSLLGFSFGLAEELDRAGVASVYTSHNYWPVCPRMYLFKEDLSLCGGPAPDARNCAPCVGAPTKAALLADRAEAGRRMLGRHVDRHLAVSTRVAELFVANGHDPARVRVLQQQPESVDWIWSRVGSQRAPEGALERPLRVGFIGSLLPQKGMHVLAAALQAFAPGQVEGHVFGGGSDAYVELLRRTDAAGHLHLHGRYDPAELPELLGSIDLVVVPSVWEDCAPLVVAEALAARTPVVASRIGGIPDFIDEGVDGLLVTPRDPDDLAAALRRFVDDPALLGRMQAAIRAPKGFDAYLDELVAEYRDVIAERRARAERVEGARSFAVLAFADELVAEPELLAAYGRTFDGGDDATLVIWAPGKTEADIAASLGGALAASGLDGEDAADLLALATPGDGGHAEAVAVARRVDAVLSRRSLTGPFAGAPAVDETRLAALRALAEDAWAASEARAA